jgi:hypothetical protein
MVKRKSKDYPYTRPVEQMGIAIVYGGIPEILNSMDNNDLKGALDEVEKTCKNDEWDLIHYPNKDGMGGFFRLITWNN